MTPETCACAKLQLPQNAQPESRRPNMVVTLAELILLEPNDYAMQRGGGGRDGPQRAPRTRGPSRHRVPGSGWCHSLEITEVR